MSDSLKDQLLKAGFSEPKPAERQKKPAKPRAQNNKNRRKTNSAAPTHGAQKQTGTSRNATQESAEVIQRRQTKAKIKTLIDDAAIKEFAGDQVYRFTLQNRIRELHIKEEIRTQIIAGLLVITRLNGSTYVVPESVAAQIRQLNPDWAIVTPGKDTPGDTAEDYGNFPVPDDLQW